MLHIVTWFWGNKYSPDYIEKLSAAVDRHTKQEHRFLVMTDRDRSTLDFCDVAAIEYPKGVTLDRNCFVRLQTFSLEWQEKQGIKPGEQILSIDVDCVVTGPLDDLVDTGYSYMIMQDGNASNPCPFNGTLQMLVAGCYQNVWGAFSLEKASKISFYEWPDDQGWIHHMLPNSAGWKCGPETGVYVFLKPGWPGYQNAMTYDLPEGARVVAFAGKRAPVKLEHLPWIKDNWK